jgi:hypothetical protein
VGDEEEDLGVVALEVFFLVLDTIAHLTTDLLFARPEGTEARCQLCLNLHVSSTKIRVDICKSR